MMTISLTEKLDQIINLVKSMENTSSFPTLNDESVSEILFLAMSKLQAHLEFEDHLKKINRIQELMKRFYISDEFIKISKQEAEILFLAFEEIDPIEYSSEAKTILLSLSNRVYEFIK